MGLQNYGGTMIKNLLQKAGRLMSEEDKEETYIQQMQILLDSYYNDLSRLDYMGEKTIMKASSLLQMESVLFAVYAIVLSYNHSTEVVIFMAIMAIPSIMRLTLLCLVFNQSTGALSVPIDFEICKVKNRYIYIGTEKAYLIRLNSLHNIIVLTNTKNKDASKKLKLTNWIALSQLVIVILSACFYYF